MATTNVTLTTAWTQVAADSDDPVLLQAIGGGPWQVAAMATEAAPSVSGHLIEGPQTAITRAVLGSGFIYAKALEGSLKLVVTK
jgi:hypothetical protein